MDYVEGGGKIAALVKESEQPKVAVQETALSEKIVPLLLSKEAISLIGKGKPAMDVVAKVEGMAGGPVITLENERYVVASVIKKANEDKLFVHLLNYDHHNTDKNVKVKLNLTGYFETPAGCEVNLLSPDGNAPGRLDALVQGSVCEFIVDEVAHYSIAVVTQK